MASTAALTSESLPSASTITAAVPWHCYAVVGGAACIPMGALWDISWHSTIGRDTFWTPAHLLIYLGGLLPGLSCGWLVLQSTFWPSTSEPQATVRLWGFRGPLGAWVTIWGSLAMLISAPFDNWWHDAYGLDVEILSPPHTVLAAGMYAVAVGALLLVLSWQNRSADHQQKIGSRMFVFTAGVLLTMSTIIVTEKSFPNQQHTSLFYQVSCAIYPLYLVAVARASKLRWSATGAALVYMGLELLMVWLLPLFPAQPKLGPIYNPVDHMVPPNFPMLLVVPAFAIDLLMLWLGGKRGWLRDWGLAILLGAVFLGLLLLVQWHFAKFLLTPWSENWFFAGNQQWPYFSRNGDWHRRFWDLNQDPVTVIGLGIALGLAILKSRIALWFGNWMSQVKR
jgi:hypothetical protein